MRWRGLTRHRPLHCGQKIASTGLKRRQTASTTGPPHPVLCVFTTQWTDVSSFVGGADGKQITQKPCYTNTVSNLTVSIDKLVLKQARIRALEEDTSVNAVVAQFLKGYSCVDQTGSDAVNQVLEDAKSTSSGSGPGGRSWRREELYERRS